jgi:hypothetical protein
VQIADILTNHLGSKAHRRHRDVSFGKRAIEIIANKLPDSYKVHLTKLKNKLPGVVTNRLSLKQMCRRFAWRKLEQIVRLNGFKSVKTKYSKSRY